MKKRLYMVAVNQAYGQNAFLPLVAGYLWCYARAQPGIADAYELAGTLWLKEPIERVLAKLEAPDVVAFSHYIWNAEWNKALARAVKQKWPACATIVGGVQVPDASPRILEEEPAFDFAIYGEGEGAFADFLRAGAMTRREVLACGLCEGVGCPCCDGLRDANYEKCQSLIWRREYDGSVVVNPRRAPVPLEDIPSPYLDGFFDDIVADRRWRYQALQETNRGCPYGCSFCAWGAASLNKLRKFPLKRIVAEFEWFAEHEIEMLYSADANFGILPRDAELVDALVALKARTGYPKLFRAAYAKNSNDLIFDISKKLSDAGMLKATTLAVQSMDERVLVNIQRKNIKYERLAELSARYEAAGIATYAEVIVGLPGETLASYVAGIDALLEAGQHDGLTIYLSVLLENTEMSSAEYRIAHGIESVKMRALQYHGTPDPDVVEELQETVVATATMPRGDLRRAVLYGWLVQGLHSLGLTQRLAKRAWARGVRYRDFYGGLYDWFLAHPGSVGGRALVRAASAWDSAVSGESWPTVDARFGPVSWPPEELLFLDIACESGRFYDELRRVVDPIEVEEQRALFIPPAPGREEEYAREAVWYARKGLGKRLRLREML